MISPIRSHAFGGARDRRGEWSRIVPWSVLVFALFSRLLCVASAHADVPSSRDELAEQLRRARGQIAREEDRLGSLKKGSAELEEQLKKIEGELDQINGRKQQTTKSIAELKVSTDAAEAELREAEQRIIFQRARMRGRLVALYKSTKRSATLDYVLNSRSVTDLLKRTKFLHIVAERDQRMLSSLAEQVSTLQSRQLKVQKLMSEGKIKLASLEAAERDLTLKREQHAALISEQRSKVELQERSLAKLNASAERFEKILSGIMGSEERVPEERPAEEQPTESVPSVPVTVAGGTVPADRVVVLEKSPFNGNGLAAQRGSLLFPVNGRVVQRFGSQKHEEFADIVFVKGLEVSSPVSSPVKAIAPGKVVMNQILPGYGNVIILDHGARYYTLYGRLASSLRSVGSEVKAGDTIGITGEPDHRGRNFYFELRIKGKATDPREYFRQVPG